jgi:glutaredoxin
MKKIVSVFLLAVLFVGLFSILPTRVLAANNVDLYLFWGDGCPHCAKEKAFLAKILPNYPSVKLNTYEIYHSQANVDLMQQAADKLNFDADGVPFLIIGDKDFVGYADGTTDKEIESQINYCLENSCTNSVASILKPTSKNTENKDSEVEEQKTDNNANTKNEKIINLPFIGEVDAMNFSLPILTVFMGAVDGFNPCAMWTLLFLISLLLGLKSRRRMWLLGVAFIMASAFVYFLFMAAWLQLILFLGFIVWVRVLIGLLAVTAGGFNLKSYIKEKNDSGCKVTGGEKRQLVFARMKAIAQQNSLWLALGGIIILAFAVNLVELVCSAGFPAVFTQVLSLSNLAGWQYYGYILLYIFFFMIDDIIIFAIAMFTLKATGISTKYGKWSKLIGGVLMLILGILLIFKPEWLMFG